MNVWYPLSHYRSHEEAALRYRECLQLAGATLVDAPTDADVAILHNELRTVPGYLRVFPQLRERRVIAYAVWETDRLPEHYRFNLGLVDEIWTASSYCRDVLTQAGVPVSVVPHVVRIPEPNRAAEEKLRARLAPQPGEFLFYTIANAANPRKGVEDLIRAFDGLFAEGEARLIVKCNSPLPPALAATRGVVQIPGLVGDDELYALHEVGQCFVSAHRSEGWGLGISDAMARGRLAVATAYGGNMDYMSAANSLPVAYTLEPIRGTDIERQPDILSSDMHWAYVDLDDLRRQMRRAVDDRDSLTARTVQARKDMAHYAADRIASILAAHL